MTRCICSPKKKQNFTTKSSLHARKQSLRFRYGWCKLEHWQEDLHLNWRGFPKSNTYAPGQYLRIVVIRLSFYLELLLLPWDLAKRCVDLMTFFFQINLNWIIVDLDLTFRIVEIKSESKIKLKSWPIINFWKSNKISITKFHFAGFESSTESGSSWRADTLDWLRLKLELQNSFCV